MLGTAKQKPANLLARSAMKPRSRENDEARKAEDRAWLELCRRVEHRDFWRCRCCQRKVVKTLSLVPERMEHHHVIPISLGGQDTYENVAVICKGCHDERHVTRILHITGNAAKKLRFEKNGRKWRG